MRTLLTGYGGFVAGHLTRLLHTRGDHIVGVGTGGAPEATRRLLAVERNVDILDAAAMRTAVAESKPDIVVHLAAQSSAARSFEEPTETFHVNALGTWNLLEAVRLEAPRARVLVVGTGEIYGPQPPGSRVTEEGLLRPVSPYALSKAAADLMADVAARSHKLDVVRTRSFGHTGPGQTPTFVVPGIARQIAAIEAGREEPVVRVGNLDVTRDLCDVRDVAVAYLRLLERGRSGAAYNVGTGRGLKLSDVVDMLVARARVPVRVEVDPARFRPADVPYLVPDVSLICRDTNWMPEIPIERTLVDVLDQWRSEPAASED